MNKKPVTSVRAASVEEVCERIQEAYNLGFMVEVYQFSASGGAYNPKLFMVDLFMPVKEAAE
ncbi:hypothetical protein [Bacillus atrophaeus]|uniref:hypothetical protein n=1 Tax=Bacillus atrophaeus TaxID=1452 RepID=UPI002DB9AD73|nr:hypothetical protein [Bacillus atrophaeus]MEC1900983.1 hypothetical protein [Bacillus atrophaeus]MEC2396148.1 hypothetical protein [Bacillus atrophaeus]MED4437320.1 hypothetical protein [Bacillus atrophaeus]MED4567064.1 hypothetical protein [Bacillus atrophaeus]MED4573386.1 hypothetical protein [Bacillus atrophaeus]